MRHWKNSKGKFWKSLEKIGKTFRRKFDMRFPWDSCHSWPKWTISLWIFVIRRIFFIFFWRQLKIEQRALKIFGQPCCGKSLCVSFVFSDDLTPRRWGCFVLGSCSQWRLQAYLTKNHFYQAYMTKDLLLPGLLDKRLTFTKLTWQETHFYQAYLTKDILWHGFLGSDP